MARVKPQDLIGNRFGLLVTQEALGKDNNGASVLRCKCDCGNIRIATIGKLRAGQVTSCGCETRRLRSVALCRHGHSTHGTISPTYSSWAAMVSRCHGSYGPMLSKYGARGISVCDRWRSSFENFLADMGERRPGTTIDRIDNRGNYEPGNCRWATLSEQARNRSSNRIVTYQGTQMSMTELAERTGLTVATLVSRIDRRGMSIKDAVSRPSRSHKTRNLFKCQQP